MSFQKPLKGRWRGDPAATMLYVTVMAATASTRCSTWHSSGQAAEPILAVEDLSENSIFRVLVLVWLILDCLMTATSQTRPKYPDFPSQQLS